MKYLLLLIPFLFVGCDLRSPPEIKAYRGNYLYHILNIEGCEYIQYGHGLAHKGNCTNQIHSYNK